MGAIVSPTIRMARRTVISTLNDLLEGKRQLYGDAFWYRHNKSTSEFFIRFRGKIGHVLILSGDSPEHLKGPNLAFAALDEPFMQQESVFTQMVARIRDPRAKYKEIGLYGTPENLGWGFELVKGTQGGKVADDDVSPEIAKLKKSMTIGVVTAKTSANETLDPGYVERLAARLSPKAMQAYLNGEFVNMTEGRVFYAFEEGPPQVVREMPQDSRFVEYGVGIDFNNNPMSAVVFWRRRGGDGRMHVVKEYQLENADTEMLMAKLKDDWGGTDGRPLLINTYPDPAGNQKRTSSPGGKTDFYYIQQAGFNVFAPQGASGGYRSYSYRDSVNIVNGLFRPGLSGAKPRLTIDPSCKKLIAALNAYSYELAPRQTALSHVLDALRYPCAFLNPLPTQRDGTLNLRGVNG
jgi:hypothetical protein